MNIGLIGVGSIGTFLLEQLNREKSLCDFQITAVFDERDIPSEKLVQFAKKYNLTIYTDLTLFLASSIELVVECANIGVAKKYAETIVREKNLLLISVGALADYELYQRIQAIAKRYKHKIYLPSGAIGGLDVLKAANILDGLTSVTLVTRKPSQALSISNLESETILFDGTAKEAIARFPKNTNISVVLSLAGIGVNRTQVKIIADPLVTKNIHYLEASGDFGNLTVTLENTPSLKNPKTSHLTALSILSTLRTLKEEIVIL